MLFPNDNFKRSAALASFLLTALLAFALDLYTKHAAFQTLVSQVVREHDGSYRAIHQRTIKFIPGFLTFEATVNQGAVFGIGQGRRILFVAVSGAAILFLFYLFAHSGRQCLYQIILGMLLAGVLGNLYDRLTLGYVRDMIHVLLGRDDLFPWIFNVADMLLCTGVALMVLYTLFVGDQRKAAPAP